MKSTCALALSFGMAAAANAAVILDATNITYSGTFAEGAVYGPATVITDGVSLSEALTISNLDTVTHGAAGPTTSWVSTDPGGYPSDFFANDGGLTVSFDILFTDTYTIDTLTTWGYGWNPEMGNNASQITVDYGVGNFDSTIAGGITLPLPTLGTSKTVDLGNITADRVRITVTDNFYDVSPGGDRVGLAEMAFVGTAAVPEPSSAALLGLGGLALILRRRK